MFKQRLRDLRLSRGLTQEKLAEHLKIAKSTISMYENGNREPDFETLEMIADYFNVNMSSLIDTTLKSGIVPLPKTKKVPLLGNIACGEPILAEENIEEYIGIDAKANVDFALRCKGDSMINARIFDGDIVYIKQQSDVDDGEIAAVLVGTEATLKKVYKYENKVVLRPCNPMYDDMVYSDEQLNEVRILGKAIMFTSMVRHGK